MKILIGDAHTLSGKSSGAIGFINESNESRLLSKKVTELLQKEGHTVKHIGVDKSNNYLKELSSIANKDKYDLVLQIHFNSFNSVAHGTEIFYYHTNKSMKEISKRINKNLSKIFTNRGVKTNKEMNGRDAWLRLNKNPAILIETCFVDNKKDVDIYNKNKNEIAKKICEGITNKTVTHETNDKLYRVIVGSYHKDNAKKMQNELITKGYKDTFLMEV